MPSITDNNTSKARIQDAFNKLWNKGFRFIRTWGIPNIVWIEQLHEFNQTKNSDDRIYVQIGLGISTGQQYQPISEASLENTSGVAQLDGDPILYFLTHNFFCR